MAAAAQADNQSHWLSVTVDSDPLVVAQVRSHLLNHVSADCKICSFALLIVELKWNISGSK